MAGTSARRRASRFCPAMTKALPAQIPHQRTGRVTEQLLHRGRVELVDALELVRMNAAGDEQAVDAETMGPCQVGAHGVADGQHMVQLGGTAAPLGGERYGALI